MTKPIRLVDSARDELLAEVANTVQASPEQYAQGSSTSHAFPRRGSRIPSARAFGGT
jgi:hypothetical protein